jgi:WXG100 family type VII secretion target
MATIRITPEELRDASTFISGKGQEVAQDIESLKAKVNEVTNTWEGAAQSSFISSFLSLEDLFKQFPEIIEGISSQLKAAADTIEQADAEIAKAFSGN